MKQVQKTPEIVSKLKASFGQDIAVDDMAVFEATALNRLPIRQRHPLFQGAIAQPSVFHDAIDSLNAESIPLQVMHQSGELPLGRVFAGTITPDSELRVLFAMSKGAQPDLVNQVDQGIIDQVSVSMLFKRVTCSSCSWDFLGADSDLFDNILAGVCGNGHTLREDGVYAQLDGVDAWSELSLVNTGGAQGAKIVGRSQSAFTQDPAYQRLAAAFGDGATTLLAHIEGPKEQRMDLTQLVNDLTTAKAANLTFETQVTTLTAARDAALAEVETLRAQVASQGQAPEAVSPEVLAAAQNLAKQSMIALGDQDPTAPETLQACVTTLTDNVTKITALIPAGGVALSAEQDSKPLPAPATGGAFRTRR